MARYPLSDSFVETVPLPPLCQLLGSRLTGHVRGGTYMLD